jgi:hypothetical protein
MQMDKDITCQDEPTSRARTSRALLLLLGAAAACGHGQPPASSPGAQGAQGSAPEAAAKVRKWMSREMAPVSLAHVEVLDGLAAGDVESKTPPKPECEKTDSGAQYCSFSADLGKDEDGDDANIVCTVTDELPVFGILLKKHLENDALDETPTVAAARVGDGIAVTFVANTTREEGDKTTVGTTKFAALYSRGFFATCLDSQAGGRKTFDRVVGHFFGSLKLGAGRDRSTLFAMGHQLRAGDRTGGFRYGAISKRADDAPGFVERSTSFWLETDGKTWSVRDTLVAVERDPKGTIEKMTELYFPDGQGPVALSAKPAEDSKKFRLKVESGEKSSGLESTPHAPLNTELWAAPELRKVASGTSPRYRYAILDVVDSDPVFHYVTLTRSAPGVLLEDDEAPAGSAAKKKAAGADPPTKDELRVDARGLVTKEVSTHYISEMLYTWGELPQPGAGRKAGGAKTGRSPR